MSGVLKLSELDPIKAYPTGITEIDEKIKMPVGSIVSVFGPEDSGKSTTGYYIMKSFLENDPRDVALVNFEQKLDLNYVATIGVDLTRVDYYDGGLLEEEADKLESKIGDYSLIVIDSLASATTTAEDKASHADVLVGDKARVVNRLMRKFTYKLNENKSTLLIINQIRDKINSYGGGMTTPGGHAEKHASFIRIRQTKQRGSDPMSIISRFTVTKNQYNGWKGTIEFTIDSSRILRGLPPVSPTRGLIMLAMEKDIIVRKGSWYSFKGTGETIEQGELNTVHKIEADEEMLTYVKAELEKVEKNG